MCSMSRASEISNNVWLGPTPDLPPSQLVKGQEPEFDVMIEAHDVAHMPDPRYLTKLLAQLDNGPRYLEFPSSGSLIAPELSQIEVYDLIDMCKWIYHVANNHQPVDADGDIPMCRLNSRPRKVLIHCSDGYTESSLLAIAYFMFAEGVPVHEAWLRLHCDKKRNFFAYPSDVSFLTHIEQRLLHESPAAKSTKLISQPAPKWTANMDGSLPSRITGYMYLGNLPHANNPELLREMGIARVLSIGESVSWPENEIKRWGLDKLLYIGNVQDNGIDPLTQEFNRCLEFIGESGVKSS